MNALDANRICSLFASGRYTEAADLNADGTITEADLQLLLDGRGVVAGDLDFDGDVDFEDFLGFSEQFGASRRQFSRGDFDCSGAVDFSDFLALSANFGHESDVAAAAVPEPSSWGIAMIGLGILLTKRRRSRTCK